MQRLHDDVRRAHAALDALQVTGAAPNLGSPPSLPHLPHLTPTSPLQYLNCEAFSSITTVIAAPLRPSTGSRHVTPDLTRRFPTSATGDRRALRPPPPDGIYQQAEA